MVAILSVFSGLVGTGVGVSMAAQPAEHEQGPQIVTVSAPAGQVASCCGGATASNDVPEPVVTDDDDQPADDTSTTVAAATPACCGSAHVAAMEAASAAPACELKKTTAIAPSRVM